MSNPLTIETSAGPLTGRATGPQQRPAALVVALHGGTYDSQYYDTGQDSLLALGAAVGLSVVALDRPGYGAATGFGPEQLEFPAQTRLLAEAVQELIERLDPERGTVLVGHSIGGMIALHVAGEGIDGVHGVEVSGLGATWQPGMVELWTSFVGDSPSVTVPAEPHADVMFGPEGTYTAQRRALDASLIRPMPMPELRSVVRWADDFPGVADRVRVPVSITFSEHDNIWATDEGSRAAVSTLFRHAPRTDVALLRGAGHCAELHKPARAHVLRQLAVIEEFLVAAHATDAA